ncbi:MAG: PIN domain-containing protein [Proteobacteria bacterium]|nr:PIN domain-containing protein [Pseudomonadota bacterium]
MKVLIDTNIVLDIALNRAPFVERAAMLWRLAEEKEITACISNTSIDEHGFRDALNSDMKDFEDAVQYVICTRNDCDCLATRNKADYGNRPNVFDPAELIEQIKTSGT